MLQKRLADLRVKLERLTHFALDLDEEVRKELAKGLNDRRSECAQLLAELQNVESMTAVDDEAGDDLAESLPPAQKRSRTPKNPDKRKGKVSASLMGKMLHVLSNNTPHPSHTDDESTYGRVYDSKAGSAHCHCLLALERPTNAMPYPAHVLRSQLQGHLGVADHNIQYFYGRGVEEKRKRKPTDADTMEAAKEILSGVVDHSRIVTKAEYILKDHGKYHCQR